MYMYESVWYCVTMKNVWSINANSENSERDGENLIKLTVAFLLFCIMKANILLCKICHLQNEIDQLVNG